MSLASKSTPIAERGTPSQAAAGATRGSAIHRLGNPPAKHLLELRHFRKSPF